MERLGEIFGNVAMWFLVILVMIFGYYLSGVINLSGFVITVLVLIILNMVGNSMERGQGVALLTLSFSGWFLIGFIPGLLLSDWGIWFN